MTIKNKWKKIRYATMLIGVFVAFCSVYTVVVYQDLQRPGVIVLLYHEIIGHDQKWLNKYQHRLSDFEEQLDYLAHEGYTTVLPSEISRVKTHGTDKKIIILSFDDGTPSHYSIAYPSLRRRSYKGIFFVIAGNVNKKYGLSASQLIEMSSNGMEIGSHSYDHLFLDELNEEQMYFQLVESRQMLSGLIGKNVISFAPPGGWYSDLALTLSKAAGYGAFFSCEIGVNDITQPTYVYKRIEVLGDMPFDEFKRLLIPSRIVDYKILQSIKFMVRRVLGSHNYTKLSELLKNRN